ncbi:Methyltransferase type 11 [Methanobacterium lacus]|uniref:Methyltransferase type 11 n=1 Tax=Methanobacterium lacus (strain AL-21) TaxID=877455 RepID=F0T777_METLA|nr:class I SAM-dependent methyltransferase [Methanobacterium lacus]ADZ10711.1 Methyltransferase type 11 [Methanobacterium lacus]
MSNKTGLMPFNGHRIQGRSSESFIDAREVISRLKLKGDEVFLDAGCGDGHTAFEAYDMMNQDAVIYAVDIYEPSIQDLEEEIEAKKITRIVPVLGNIAGDIPIPDNTLDMTLMINVFHGFVAQENLHEAVEELKRITKPCGKIAIMDYKKKETKYGPPFFVRQSPEELEDLFKGHDLKLTEVDNQIGETLEDGSKSHYLVIFEK